MAKLVVILSVVEKDEERETLVRVLLVRKRKVDDGESLAIVGNMEVI